MVDSGQRGRHPQEFRCPGPALAAGEQNTFRIGHCLCDEIESGKRLRQASDHQGSVHSGTKRGRRNRGRVDIDFGRDGLDGKA